MRQVALQLGTRALVGAATADTRHRTARIIFLGAFAFNAALTAFWLATFCLVVVSANNLGTPWLVLSGILATSNCLLELYSPRGTDDFTMGTTNALICWAFGAWLY